MATPTSEIETGLELSAAEREVLAQEVAAFAENLTDPAGRERYTRLATAVEQGIVPPELVGFLATMLELVLPTQRVRRQYGHDADQALLRLWQRTPRGVALKQAAQDVNVALGALSGQTLESIAFSPTPRGHSLSINTLTCHLSLTVDRSGVSIDSMEVGG